MVCSREEKWPAETQRKHWTRETSDGSADMVCPQTVEREQMHTKIKRGKVDRRRLPFDKARRWGFYTRVRHDKCSTRNSELEEEKVKRGRRD